MDVELPRHLCPGAREQDKTPGHGIACKRECALYGRKAEALSGVESSIAKGCLQRAAVPFDTGFCR